MPIFVEKNEKSSAHGFKHDPRNGRHNPPPTTALPALVGSDVFVATGRKNLVMFDCPDILERQRPCTEVIIFAKKN
jgi:hypothetical protein